MPQARRVKAKLSEEPEAITTGTNKHSKIDDLIEKLAPYKSNFRKFRLSLIDQAFETVAYCWEITDEIDNMPSRIERDAWKQKITNMEARTYYVGAIQYFLGYDREDLRRDTALAQYVRNMGGALEWLARNFRPQNVEHAVVVHELTSKNKTISELAKENHMQRSSLAAAEKISQKVKDVQRANQKQAELGAKAKAAGFDNTEEYILDLEIKTEEARLFTLKRKLFDNAEPVARMVGDFTFYCHNQGKIRQMTEHQLREVLINNAAT
jgi:hypothetical protein